jgi:hypothetical protein
MVTDGMLRISLAISTMVAAMLRPVRRSGKTSSGAYQREEGRMP